MINAEKNYRVEFHVLDEMLQEGIALDLRIKVLAKKAEYINKSKELQNDLAHTRIKQFSNANWKEDVNRLEQELKIVELKVEVITDLLKYK